METENGLRVVEASGVAFISDVHLWSRKPGRRRDENFADTLFRKLEAALGMAASMNLLPVFLGDIFHCAVEPDEALKGRLIRLLASQPLVPDSNVGNHDIAGETLAPGDSLSLVASTGVLRVLAHGGPATIVRCPSMDIGIGFTPHGGHIPDSVSHAFPEGAAVIWITHHDLGFGGGYPGSIPLKPIHGCKLVVNGHMHNRQEMKDRDGTVWFNPGSLTRTAVDQAGHEPTLWVMREEGDFNLESFVLPFRRDVFDLTGRLVAPGQVDAGGEVREWRSAFAEALGEDSFDPIAMDEATLLEEEIQRRFEADATPPEVRDVVLNLLRKARQPAT